MSGKLGGGLPAMVALTEEQRGRIQKYIPDFVHYMQSPKAIEDQKQRLSRQQFFAGLTKEKVEAFEEAEIGALIASLWASQIWGNKQYLVNKIIERNTLEVVRREIAHLLFADESVSGRYDRFLRHIKGLGPASVTEMLSFVAPQSCGIWNRRARVALDILGFGEVLPLNKYRITAQELEQFNAVLRAVAAELLKAGATSMDLLGVDYFLYEVQREAPPTVPVKLEREEEFDHDELRDQIRDIGQWLGFESEVEKTIAHGARVDVVWQARIANLGVVTYVFEVQKSGSIDGLILNLQRARSNPTVQKVIAVSDSEQIERIRKETEGLPGEFRKTLTTWRVEDVQRAHRNLSEAFETLRALELVKDIFPIG